MKVDTYCQPKKSSAGDSSFWQCKVCMDIRAGSLETSRQRTDCGMVALHLAFWGSIGSKILIFGIFSKNYLATG